MTAKEFYEENATTTVNVPRVGHPEDKSGWDGVRRASQAQYIAPDVEVMPLWDVFDFADKFRQARAASQREGRSSFDFPEKDGKYLVLADGEYTIAHFTRKTEHVGHWSRGVKLWWPLPAAPPKEAKNDRDRP